MKARSDSSKRDWPRRRMIGGALVAALVLAPAAMAGIAGRIGDVALLAPERATDERENFPGSAYFDLAEDFAAPAPGVTGTAPLPALPADASIGFGDTSVVSARPFMLRGAPADQSRALECLTAAIYYEAASESDDGQRAVAQVVLNRVRHQAFPASVCGVVYQGSERVTGCQFSFSCDGAMARTPSTGGWARARRHAAAALAGHVFAPAGLATHYHTYAVKPRWNRSLVMTTAIGAHFFHRWKGYWGTAAGFSERHSGAEPFAGPKPRAAGYVPAVASTPMTVAEPALASSEPAYVTSGKPVEPAPAEAESQIQDKYRDSGEWIAR